VKLKDVYEFDWDEHNKAHLEKHGISRSDAEDVLTGDHILLEAPDGRQRATVDCGRWESKRPHLEHRVCRAGRGDSPNNGLDRGQGNGGSISRTMGTGISMAKAKMKQVVIPKFSSEAKEAAWWDAHRSEIESEIRQRVKQKQPLTLANLLQGAKSSQPITLRIPKEDLETARRLAAQKGLGYQTYIKMLLREALAKNAVASAD
jgi:predicted DNA binding CopG/RHH family protein